MIPESFIQELLHRVDVVDLIDGYVPLKKAGANFAACCPFHNEKSPSFTAVSYTHLDVYKRQVGMPSEAARPSANAAPTSKAPASPGPCV